MAKTLLKLKQLETVATNKALVSDGSGNVSASATTATEIGYLDITTLGTAERNKALTASGADKITLGSFEIEGTNFDINGGDIAAATISGGLTWSANQDMNNVNLTNIDIDSGAIDGAIIGGNSAAAGTFTTCDATTDFTIDGLVLTADTITNDAVLTVVSTGLTLNASLDIALSADGGNVTMDDGQGVTVFDFDVDGTIMTIHDNQDTGDLFSVTIAQHGATTFTTVDDDAAAANLVMTIDGTVDIDSQGLITIDSGAGIALEPAAGSAVLIDGTVSIDAGVVTGVSSLTLNLADASGDPTISFAQGGTVAVTMGIDDTDNVWKLHSDTALAGSSDVSLSAAGVLTVASLTPTILTTTAAQKLTIMQGAAANVDIGAYDMRASTVTADSLTSGRVPFASTAGLLIDDGDFTFATDTLTVTKLGAFEAAGAINFSDEAMTNVDINSGAIDGAIIGTNSAAAGTFVALTGTVLRGTTSLQLATGATVTGIDNGALGSSATLLATAGAVKTYVDNLSAGLRHLKPIYVATTGELSTNAAGVSYVNGTDSLRSASGTEALPNQDGVKWDPTDFNNTESLAKRILVKDQAGVKGSLRFDVLTIPQDDEYLKIQFAGVWYKLTFDQDNPTANNWTKGGDRDGQNWGTNGDEAYLANIDINAGPSDSIDEIFETAATLFGAESTIAAVYEGATNNRLTLEQVDPMDASAAAFEMSWKDSGHADEAGRFDTYTEVAGVSSRNGVYWCYALGQDGGGGSFWELRRASDAIDVNNLSSAAVWVEAGAVNGDAGFVQQLDSIEANIDDGHQAWVQYTGTYQITNGEGIDKTGNTLAFDIGKITTAYASDNNLHDTQDKFAMSDNGAGKSLNFQNLYGNIFRKVSGDATVAVGGALTLANNSVSQAQLDDNAVGIAELNAMGQGKIFLGDGSGDPSLLSAGTAHQLLQSNGTTVSYVSMSGDATLNAGVLTLANNSVSIAQMDDNAVGIAELADIARGSIIIGDSGDDPLLLAKGSAHTFLQSDGTDIAYVTLSGDATLNAGVLSLAADCVDSAEIADDAINSEHYTNGSVDFVHVQDVAANSLLIRNANSSGVLSELAVADTKIVIGDGTGFGAFALSGNATMTNGGAVTVTGTAVNAIDGAALNISEHTVVATDASTELSAAIAVAVADQSAATALQNNPLTQLFFNGLMLKKAVSLAKAQSTDGDAGDWWLVWVDASPDTLKIAFEGGGYADGEEFQLILCR